MITQGDLHFDFVDVARDSLKILLLALRNDVEGVANLQIERFVLRRVIDPVLTDKLQAAVRIRLVDTDRSRRHRHAEARLLLVLELIEHLDVVFDG